MGIQAPLIYAAVSPLILPIPAFKVWRTGTALKPNRYRLQPGQAVIGGAFVLPCTRKSQSEIRKPGDLFPAGTNDDDHKNCRNWGPWYAACADIFEAWMSTGLCQTTSQLSSLE